VFDINTLLCLDWLAELCYFWLRPYIKFFDEHDSYFQDRAGDTNLIHAVKGGHRGVVEALLKKYADVDISGKVSISLFCLAIIAFLNRCSTFTSIFYLLVRAGKLDK
jgi:hypothetical protein